ncbi:Ltp family lipoprotein [Mycoplasma sp. P36-A1]|uniref:Ltp family lipoprotein n=1 Tax=Mycoplasma sp. P36-A1 TaxID=3252900 RepID=UPI003C2EC66D
MKNKIIKITLLFIVIAIPLLSYGNIVSDEYKAKENDIELINDDVTEDEETNNSEDYENVYEAARKDKNKALEAAQNYIEYMSFSEENLKDQLEYDKVPNEFIKYAVENVKADYNKEALDAAKNYVKLMDMSKEDLQRQLKYEKYTDKQIEYALNNLDK